MKIRIRTDNIEVSDILRNHVERRIGLCLARFGDRIGRVNVLFSASGVEKRCEIDVGVRARDVRVEDINADLFAAVENVASRVSRAVARALDRERERD